LKPSTIFSMRASKPPKILSSYLDKFIFAGKQHT
jgi:hypothetical protein